MWIGGQSNFETDSKTRYRCYDVSEAPCGAAPSLTADSVGRDRLAFNQASTDGVWFTSIFDSTEQYVTPPALDDSYAYLYANSTACYDLLYIPYKPEFGTETQIPHDTNDDVTIMVVAYESAAEADQFTGPACAGVWEASTPSASLKYRTTNALTHTYMVYTRASVDAWWTALGGPWDHPPYTDTGFTIAQTTGLIWWRSAVNKIKVWDARTQYSAASVTELTLPSGNIFGWFHWGEHTFITGSDGKINVYVGTTWKMVVPSPLDPSTWDWVEGAFGWLVVTEYYDKIHFFRMTDAGVEFRQTLTYDSSMVYGFVDAAPVTEDCVVSGTWSRILYDHSTGLWGHGGQMAHVQEQYADSWVWIGSVYRHIIMRKQLTYPDSPLPDSSWNGYYYNLVQVI
jgi:hypothetical protein